MSDVLVVGGGHNGLIAALRLARAGRRVTVVEQGAEPGGCVWTDRHPSGVLVERGAFEHGGVYPMAVELGLDDPALGDRAVRYREHPVLAGVAFGDGQRRVFYSDVAATVAALGADGPGYRHLVELADALFGMLDTFGTAPTLTQVAAALAALPGGDELFRTLLQPAETVLDAAVSDPHTRAAMALQPLRPRCRPGRRAAGCSRCCCPPRIAAPPSAPPADPGHWWTHCSRRSSGPAPRCAP
ncbi:FAD-dependent oxidoreductase, partial [Mycolicibacterium vanbaalenii PYR-1]|nr:FAD-dependent oxidoreductase [Mycolicibacterium vanbaalenii PYR-1]